MMMTMTTTTTMMLMMTVMMIIVIISYYCTIISTNASYDYCYCDCCYDDAKRRLAANNHDAIMLTSTPIPPIFKRRSLDFPQKIKNRLPLSTRQPATNAFLHRPTRGTSRFFSPEELRAWSSLSTGPALVRPPGRSRDGDVGGDFGAQRKGGKYLGCFGFCFITLGIMDLVFFFQKPCQSFRIGFVLCFYVFFSWNQVVFELILDL